MIIGKERLTPLVSLVSRARPLICLPGREGKEEEEEGEKRRENTEYQPGESLQNK